MSRERRRVPREKHRVSCQFSSGGRTASGFVSDVSARGVFVQCSGMPPEDGAPVALVLRDARQGELRVNGRVARRRASHRSIAAVEVRGFGIEIDILPEGFQALLAGLLKRGEKVRAS
jgi:hypothetical protein